MMKQYRRSFGPGGSYFFTVVTAGRRPLLASLACRRALREAIDLVRQERPFLIDAWVTMPDHIHTVWTLPTYECDYARRWQLIKSQVTHTLGESIWQPRYWEHQIRDERDMEAHIDYLHWNPVKHGLVAAVRDWPWSSFHRYVRLGVYPEDWGGVAPPDISFGAGE